MNIFYVFQVFILNSRCIKIKKNKLHEYVLCFSGIHFEFPLYFCIEIYTEYYLRIVNLCKRIYRAYKLLA